MNGQCRQSGDQDRIAAIVGLGNPGRDYESTRHNAGFLVADRIAGRYAVGLQERKFKASWGTGAVEGQKLLVVKPLTYMNRSGEPVGQIARFFDIPPGRILVIHDDLDLPMGKIKLARRGGAGGHKGVLSIIEHFGTQDFPRLKLGIGRPLHGEPVESFVLQPPYPGDRGVFDAMIEQAEEIVRAVLETCFSEAMNRFNRRDQS